MSLQFYLRDIEKHQFKDPNVRMWLILLGKIFALKQLTVDS